MHVLPKSPTTIFYDKRFGTKLAPLFNHLYHLFELFPSISASAQTPLVPERRNARPRSCNKYRAVLPKSFHFRWRNSWKPILCSLRKEERFAQTLSTIGYWLNCGVVFLPQFPKVIWIPNATYARVRWRTIISVGNRLLCFSTRLIE